MLAVALDKAIGLLESWPTHSTSTDELSVEGHVQFAAAYLESAELLCADEKAELGSAIYVGPLLQLVGLSAELTFKVILYGAGYSEKEVRRVGHSTYAAYCEAKEYFDEVKFFDVYFSKTDHLPIPSEVYERNQSTEKGGDIHLLWRVYFFHLQALDSTYDRPYQNRYAKPGHFVMPDAKLLIIGTKIIQKALNARIEVT